MLIKMLNKTGPKIEHCGVHTRCFFNELKLKSNFISVEDFISNPELVLKMAVQDHTLAV